MTLTKSILLQSVRGLQRHRLSYGDSRIWATAKPHDVPKVLSEDFNDGDLLEGARFLNPFTTTFDLDWLQPRR